MILFAREDLKAEFHGEKERKVQVELGETERVVLFSPSCRAIIVAMAYEIDRIFDADFLVTSVLRDWVVEDRAYPERARIFGNGAQKGKPYGPHIPGRAADGIPQFKDGISRGPGDRLFEVVIGKAELFLNTVFPYGWNNKSRGATPFKTGLRHTKYADGKSLGDHLHIQLSY